MRRALILSGLIVSGCLGGGGQRAAMSDTSTVDLRDRDLGSGDVLEVKVFREENLSGTFQVDGAGQIDFPLLGGVQAAGIAPAELAARLERSLADGYLVDPQVTVRVQESKSKRVHVLGQVTKPGSFDFRPDMTIIEAITAAGGFAPTGASNSVRLTRVTSAGEQRFTIRVGDIRQGQRPNFKLLPGDVIYVPQTLF